CQQVYGNPIFTF
nr:immunoglobulin light chain junction region [Macaca mulatta]MOV82843.1 immunoglobulin light chain junction region [Macaca mulatta]MOV85731.1 immunoglobulin light chain junction region [Macaca mulatta]MOV86062.1 immunoglobulin light chain junction region [Macaca mulatta]